MKRKTVKEIQSRIRFIPLNQSTALTKMVVACDKCNKEKSIITGIESVKEFAVDLYNQGWRLKKDKLFCRGCL